MKINRLTVMQRSSNIDGFILAVNLSMKMNR